MLFYLEYFRPYMFYLYVELFSELTADMDASDVRLGEYNGTVADLESQIDQISARIRARIEYYATCDV